MEHEARKRRSRTLAPWLAALAVALAVTVGLDRAAWGQDEPATELQASDAPPAGPPVAAFVSIDGPIDSLTERTLEVRVKRAMERAPRFLVVAITSPGGEVEASRTIAWNLHNLEDVTVVAWIRGRALSGATMAAFGCDLIAMRGDGQLGDVMPISVDAFGVLAPEVAEKMITPVRKDLRDLAELQGYPGDVAAAMVDPRVELHRIEVKDEKTGRLRPEWLTAEALAELPFERRSRVQSDEIIDTDTQLLVIGPDQAQDMGIARIIADDEATLLAALAVELSVPEVVAVHEGSLWWEHVVRWVTWWPVKVLLFVIGIVALAIALSAPGQGPPEVIAALAFGAVFFGSYLIGLADHVELLLFVFGLVLLGVELFVTPGFGVVGVAGIVLLGASLLLSFQKFVLPGTPGEWELFRDNVARTVLGGAGGLAALVVLARFAPWFRPFGRLEFTETLPSTLEPTAAQELAPVGTNAEATTVLRPVGKVKVGLDVFDAVAEEGFVAAGQAVVVIGHRAGQLVVSVRPEATTTHPGEATA
jgi:membrane-bound serine protease (ClpP class)